MQKYSLDTKLYRTVTINKVPNADEWKEKNTRPLQDRILQVVLAKAATLGRIALNRISTHS